MPVVIRDGSIHTSDRILFRRCRRKWNWQSRIRGNLTSRESRPVPHFWFGSGWHWAMEDYHGYRKFPTMADAFEAYVKAHTESNRPYEWDKLLELANGMAHYYTTYWLPRHDDFHTLWLREGETTPRKAGDGIPQLEVDFSLQIPGREDKTPFAGTFDGIVTDDYGRWWIKEIKTAKKMDIYKLDTDPQISGYCLAAEQHYRHEFEGVVYIQFLKDVPKEARVLKEGKISTDTSQKTTYDVYRAGLIKAYGSIPNEYEETLQHFMELETFEGNRFIRQDRVERNQNTIQNEIWKLQAEAEDMLNPNLPLYPNPTYTCQQECEFKAACVAFDEDSDWESILEEDFEERKPEFDWRSRLSVPS